MLAICKLRILNLDCAGWRGGAIWATAGGDPGAAWHCCQWCQEAYGWFQQENALVSGFDPHIVQAAGFYTVESVVYAPKKKLMEIKVKPASNWLPKCPRFLKCFKTGREWTEGWQNSVGGDEVGQFWALFTFDFPLLYPIHTVHIRYCDIDSFVGFCDSQVVKVPTGFTTATEMHLKRSQIIQVFCWDWK